MPLVGGGGGRHGFVEVLLRRDDEGEENVAVEVGGALVLGERRCQKV